MPTVSIAQALQLGIQHHQAGRLAEAESIYRQILAQDPNHADSLHMLAVLAWQGGQSPVAEQLIRKAIAICPSEPTFHGNLGKMLHQAGRFAEAAAAHREAVRLKPEFGEAYFDLGLALAAAGQLGAALEAYGAAQRIKPDDAGVLNNMGNILRAMGRASEAVSCFERALQSHPTHIESLGNLGQFCESQGRYQEAITYYERALAVNPNHPTLQYNMGVALSELGRIESAVQHYQQAVRLKPDYFEAFNNLANVIAQVGRLDEAIIAYQEALRLNPGLFEAWSNLGAAFISCARHDEAIASQRRAMELNPQNPRAHSNLAYTLIFLPQYDAQAIQQEHARWNQRHCAPFRHLIAPHENDRDPERRLRIGYVSPDFREHVVGRNLAPVFREHNRSGFEVICYSNVSAGDSMTDWFRSKADVWHDIRFKSDEEVLQLIRHDRIDILVDLSLHMAWNRLPLFAHKPAPLQVTFAGYPGTTGLETMDYRLTDPHLDPLGTDDHLYSETSIRLPHSFWCYDPLGEEHFPSKLPALANGYITFGCLNSFSKVNDPLLRLWSQVLAAVGNSRLLILSPEGKHRQRTLEFLRQQGIAPERIEFTPVLPCAKYLQLYRKIDIVLDPIPYNGHTTSLDALWMGVPLITMTGSTVVGRAGTSQLKNLGLTDLITHDAASYVAAAAALARNLPRLEELRTALRGRMERSPLMDGPSFTRAIEAAYRDMWKKWCAAGGIKTETSNRRTDAGTHH